MKKNDTSGLLVVILMVGLPLFFFAAYWKYILVFAGVVIAIYGVCLLSQSKRSDSVMRGVDYAYIVGRTTCMTTRSRPSGYSVSSRGNVRAYWRYQKEVDHVDIEFEVHNRDGTVQNVTTEEGSSLYKRLSPYVRLKPEPSATRSWPPPAKELQKTVEPPKIEATVKKQEIAELPAKVEEAKPTIQKAKEEKYYADVPFEIAPNEFNLKISYPSCQMVKWESGEHRIYVRFGITYDPTVKGVRNRVVKCATVDKEGRMTAVEKEWKVLDLSGSKLIEIMFADNAEQEPAKIVVGLDRHD